MLKEIRRDLDSLKRILSMLEKNPTEESWAQLTEYSRSFSLYLTERGDNAEYELMPIKVKDFEKLCDGLRSLIELKNKDENYSETLGLCLRVVERFRSM